MTLNADRPSADAQAPAKGDLLHKRIFYAGTAILVAGLIGAALIYVLSSDNPGEDSAMAMANRRSYEFQIERIGGMATVYAVRLNEWVGSLWHGRRLAFTIGVLAIVIAAACFWVARLLAASLTENNEEDRNG